MKRMYVLLSTNTFFKKELVLQTRQCLIDIMSIFMCTFYAAQGVFNFYPVTYRFFTVEISMEALML